MASNVADCSKQQGLETIILEICVWGMNSPYFKLHYNTAQPYSACSTWPVNKIMRETTNWRRENIYYQSAATEAQGTDSDISPKHKMEHKCLDNKTVCSPVNVSHYCNVIFFCTRSTGDHFICFLCVHKMSVPMKIVCGLHLKENLWEEESAL